MQTAPATWTPHGARLALPVVAAPMFILATPDLVVAQCTAGIVGSIPALNARPIAQLDAWLDQIRTCLAAHDRQHPQRPAAPFAVNLIVHRSNQRIDDDLAACVRHRVPVVITSLSCRPDVNQAIQAYGGIVLHDVTNLDHARKAVDRGADGLIAVAAGAGGHAGTLSPFALVQEIRQWWAGPLLLGGCIASGRAVLAAQAMGADLAYVGTRFITAREANAVPAYKSMVAESAAADILYTDHFTGIAGNYLKPSIRAAGLDPEALAPWSGAPGEATADKPRTWKDIWGAGQGVAANRAEEPAADIIAGLRDEYLRARAALGGATPD